MRSNRIRRAALTTTLILGGLVVAMAVTLKSPESPEAFDIATLVQLGDRENLWPHMRRLVEELEANRLLGSKLDAYRGDFEQADEIQQTRSRTTYLFFVYPASDDQEGLPVLGIQVRKKDLRIVHARVFEPDW